MSVFPSAARPVLAAAAYVAVALSFTGARAQAATDGGVAPQAVEDRSDKACLECHADLDNVEKRRLVIDPKVYRSGPHDEDSEAACVSCHVKAKTVADISDHGKLGPATCDGCHDDVTAGMAKGQHQPGNGHHSRSKLPTCGDCHGRGHRIVAVNAPNSPVRREQQPKTCGKCHGGGLLARYLKSIHGKKLTGADEHAAGDGQPGAGEQPGADRKPTRPPTCSNCHAAHAVEDANITRNPPFKAAMVGRCGGCHKAEHAPFVASVHGVALLEHRVYDSASCVDCHMSHEILPAKDPGSAVYPTKVERDCAGCHADAKLIRRFNLPSTVVGSYDKSYHGRASHWGDAQAANCSSCHDNHGIFKHSDPRSSIHPDNLRATCGKCHPSASANFIKGQIHVDLGARETFWPWMVKQTYIWLIIVVISLMVLHNALDFLRKLRQRIEHQRGKPYVERMARSERLAHLAVMGSFILLAYTGFAIMYPFAWWAEPLHWVSSSQTFRSTAHRVGGTLLTLMIVQHMWFVLFTARGREQRRRFWPGREDVRHLWQNISFYLGRRPERPAFGRFTYMEKVEYWALVWGTAVMAVTGMVLWFKGFVLQWVPKEIFDVCLVIHRYEAILAVLSIIVWHFYFVLLNPDEAPLSTTWITGRVPLEELEEQHRGEYEEIVAGEELKRSERDR